MDLQPVWVLLEDWIEIKVSGPETIKFLNGIITKDLQTLKDGEITRAAFLTPQAKVRSVFWILLIGEAVYFYCPDHMKQALIEDLLKYKLSMDVKLEDITEETDSLYLVSNQKMKIPGLSNDSISFNFIHAQSSPNGNEIIYKDFTDLLIKEGIAPTEIMVGENPYELGISDVISLEKGCFLGQEPISRMYHRGNPRKYLYQIEFPKTEDHTIKTSSGEEVGQLIVKSDNIGLAFIRRTVSDLDQLFIEDRQINVRSKVGNYPHSD